MGTSPLAEQERATLYWHDVPGVVRVSASKISMGLPAALTACSVVVCVFAVGVGWWFGSDWWTIMCAAAGVITMVVWLLGAFVTAGGKARVRELLRRTSTDTWQLLAERALARARSKSTWTWGFDPRRGVHESEWFEQQPQLERDVPRPKAIFVRVRPVLVPGGDDLAEQVEVGPSRRLTAEDRRKRLKDLGKWSVLMLFVLVPYVFIRATPPYFWVYWLGAQLLAVVYRMGWGPILIESSIASPGKLELIRWGRRTQEFTVDDSVLVVEPVGDLTIREISAGSGQISVHVTRRDGRVASLLFDSTRDPGLSDLLLRWLGTAPAAPKDLG